MSGDKLGFGFSADFGYLLDHSRQLRYEQLPDYEDLNWRFSADGQYANQGPLDWSVVEKSITEEHIDWVEVACDDEDNWSGSEDEGEREDRGWGKYFTDSYRGWDIADWDRQDARDRSLTLPDKQVELVASTTSQIIEVIE